jgi:hypothetical protein
MAPSHSKRYFAHNNTLDEKEEALQLAIRFYKSQEGE